MSTIVVNLTPHPIYIVDDVNTVVCTYLPRLGDDGKPDPARVSTTCQEVGSIHGIPIVKTNFGEVQGLPDFDGDHIYIVSMVVAQAVSGRSDIVGPDTGPSAYRVDGKIVGVRQFARY